MTSSESQASSSLRAKLSFISNKVLNTCCLFLPCKDIKFFRRFDRRWKVTHSETNFPSFCCSDHSDSIVVLHI